VLEATEGAHAAVHAGAERHREATELVAKATDLHGRVRRRADGRDAAALRAAARALAREPHQRAVGRRLPRRGQRGPGGGAASQHLDELRSFNDWAQSALRAADAPPRPAALPQLPPLPPAQLFEAMRRQEAADAVLAYVKVPNAAVRLLRLRSGWRAWVAAVGNS